MLGQGLIKLGWLDWISYVASGQDRSSWVKLD